jgi:hypothetical protein
MIIAPIKVYLRRCAIAFKVFMIDIITSLLKA